MEPENFVSADSRNPRNVQGVVVGPPSFTDLLGNAPTTEYFHRTWSNSTYFGVSNNPVRLLDKNAVNSLVA
jgi:hypothetical protein